MNTILEEIKNSSKPVTKIIRKTADFKVFAIGLNTGVALKNHKAPGRTKLIVIEGRIDYNTSNKTITLHKFDEFEIPLKETHEVTAHEPSVFILVVG